MKWFSNLFKKKSETSQANSKWLEGYRSFEKGKEFYLKKQMREALDHFDLAIENGYEDDNVYGFRAGCLQELNYGYDAIEDLNKAISLSPNDCHNYFCRSLSKWAILDLEGEIADLEKAIELSKEDNELNRAYNDEAKRQGHRNGVSGIFQMSLIRSKMDLEFEMENRKRIENATSPEWKAELQKMSDERRAKKLNRIKRRRE